MKMSAILFFLITNVTIAQSDFDKFFKERSYNEKEVKNERFFYPINNTSERYIISFSTSRIGDDHMFLVEHHLNTKNSRALNNILKIKQFKPRYSLGMYASKHRLSGSFWSLTLRLGRFKGTNLYSKVIFDIENKNLKPLGSAIVYIDKSLGFGNLNKNDHTLVYAGVYINRISLSEINTINFRTEARSIFRNHNVIYGVSYKYDIRSNIAEFSLEFKDSKNITGGIHVNF